jgi:hypothetical protein
MTDLRVNQQSTWSHIQVRGSPSEYSLGVFRRRTPTDVHTACGQPGVPGDLRFGFPTSFYVDAYRSHRAAEAALDAAQRNGENGSVAVVAQLSERRARAKWAIASRGVDAIPFVVQMLGSHDPEESDDAREILALMGNEDRIVDSLISSIANATDADSANTLIIALGATANPRGIPYLARILSAPGIDLTIMRTTIESIGLLGNRRFDYSSDPVATAAKWLERNGYSIALPVRGGSVDPNGDKVLGDQPEDLWIDAGEEHAGSG